MPIFFKCIYSKNRIRITHGLQDTRNYRCIIPTFTYIFVLQTVHSGSFVIFIIPLMTYLSDGMMRKTSTQIPIVLQKGLY